MAEQVKIEFVADMSSLIQVVGKSSGLIQDFSTKTGYAATKLDKVLGNGLIKAGTGFENLGAKSKATFGKMASDFSTVGGAAASKLGAMASQAKNTSLGFKTLTGSVKEFFREVGDEGMGSLAGLRYALYDLSSTFRTISVATLGAATAVVTLSSKFETAFTDIERTTMGTSAVLESLKRQFTQLAREIPMSFADITAIGAIGAQLGVADGDLASFTETVAQFSATTNVSSEEAAKAFGAIGELLDITASQYVNLGSAIAFVGLNSVATESEVIAVTQAISAVAANAGLSKEYVVGLSGALASLKVPAEQSRGALTRTFQEINRAAANGGEQLDNFARVAGMSAEQVQALLATDGGMEQFFQTFLQGLSGMGTQQLTTTLDALSLSDLRVTNTLTRLSQNLDVVDKSIGNSAAGFENGALLATLYDKRVEDLASKFQILTNSLQELGASFGDSVAPLVGAAVDALTDFVQGISDVLKTDAGKNFAQIAVSITAIVGVLTAVAATAIITAASITAFQYAMANLGIAGATTGLKGFIAGMVSAKTATDGAALAGARFATVMKGIGIVGIVVAVLQLSEAFKQAGNSASLAFQKYVGDTGGMVDAITADTRAMQEAIASGNQEVVDSFYTFQTASQSNKDSLNENAQAILDINDAFGGTNGILDETKDSVDGLTLAIGSNTLAWLRNKLVASEEFQKLFKDKGLVQAISSAGIDMQTALAIAANGTAEDVNNYFLAQITATKRGGAAAIDTWTYVLEALRQILVSTPIIGGFLDSMIPKTLIGQIREMANTIGGAGAEMQIFGQDAEQAGNSASGAGTDIEGMGDKAADAAKKIRTLLDYASDLSTVWKRAFDIRFSGAQTLDSITKSFRSIAESTSQAAEEIQSLNADIDSLTADRALEEYFLSVAEAYGDTLRAQEIRANLAKIDAELVNKNKQLQKAQDKTNKTLVGNSDAAIENRSTINSLVTEYQDHLQALAASGLGQDELRKKSAELKADFIAQATQLGYNVDELKIYAAAFDDVTYAIDNIPRDITPGLDININPALTALAELNAKAQGAGETSASNFNSGFGGGVQSGVSGLQDWLKNNPLEVKLGEINLPEWFTTITDITAHWFDLKWQIEKVFEMIEGWNLPDWLETLIKGLAEGLLRAASAVFNPFALLQDMLDNIGAFFSGGGQEPASSGKKPTGKDAGKGNIQPASMEVTPIIPPSYYKDIDKAEKRFSVFQKSVTGDWSTIGKNSSTTMSGVKTDFTSKTGGMEARWGTFASNAPKKVNDNKSLLDTAFEGWNSLFGAKTSSMDSKMGTFASNAPRKINENKSPLDVAFEGWNSIFGNKTSSMTGKFNSFTGAIPGSISAQNGAVGNNSYALGTTSASRMNSGLSNNLDIAGRVSGNVNDARYPAGVNASSVGRSIGDNISGGISSLLNNLLGWNSVPRRIIRSITGFADGGYTGAGGKYEVAGVVHRGEYVVPKQDVNQSTGLPYWMSQMPKFYSGGMVGGSGGAGSSSPTIVELSPYDRKLLAAAGNVELRLDGKVVAAATNANNFVSAQRGTN